MKSRAWKSVIPVLVGAAIALIPAPHGLAPNAWHYFALFAAVIVGLILEPVPAAAVGVIGVALGALLGLVNAPAASGGPKLSPADESIKWALAGFSNATVWLIFSAFIFSLGYARTGFGKRIALFFVKALGRRTLGLGYAVTLADLILAPLTPSNTARSGGTIYPIIRNIPEMYGSYPGESSRKIGSYLMWTAFAATCVTSSMFLTALAPNLLALEMVRKVAGLEISWAQWFVGFLPVGALLIAALPFLVYVIYPPEIKVSREVPAWAARELDKMGRITRRELIMAVLVVLALALWIFGGSVINATTVGLAAVALMLVTGIVSWEDILGHRPAWNVLVWFATLVTLADGLSRVGFVSWLAPLTTGFLSGVSPTLMMAALAVIFFVVHYLFASITAHVTAVLPVMLAAGVAVPGMSPRVFALLLCYSLGIMGVLTPYATGPGPVYYGSGYVSRKDFWTLGLVFGFIFLAALLLIGLPYLSAIF